MHASIVIASHNEGSRLARTVESCLASVRSDLEFEIVVADDASTDGSVDAVAGLPCVRVARNSVCQGVSAAKDLGARQAQGAILVFLDAHCKPEAGAIERLVADVGSLSGRAVVAPRVAALDETTWENFLDQCGNGYLLDLETFDERWIPLKTLRRYRSFYASPNLAGCCLAISRVLYLELGGFDAGMKVWGCEQVDFGLKAWLMGYSVLNDIDAVVGHHFRLQRESRSAAEPQILANQMRTARKHFSEPVWEEWLSGSRQRFTPEVWNLASSIFATGRASAEAERHKLFRNRIRDEFWYADEFELHWPLCVQGIATEVAEYRRRSWSRLAERSRGGWQELKGNAVGMVERSDGIAITIALTVSDRVWGGLYVEDGAYECRGSSLAATYAGLLLAIIEGRTLATISQLEPADLLRRRNAGGEEELEAAALVIGAFRRALSAGAVSKPPCQCGVDVGVVESAVSAGCR